MNIVKKLYNIDKSMDIHVELNWRHNLNIVDSIELYENNSTIDYGSVNLEFKNKISNSDQKSR